MPDRKTLSRESVIQAVADNIFSGRVLNNTHRGDVVEMMVLAALEPNWQFVGLGWHPWDLQCDSGTKRLRIQVKQSAALQLWGPTKHPSISFGWSKNPPSYFERNNPGEVIESEGWFCEIFVIGVHQGTDFQSVDQANPDQWRFLIIPTKDLKKGTNSIVLTKALRKWEAVKWGDLREKIALVSEELFQP